MTHFTDAIFEAEVPKPVRVIIQPVAHASMNSGLGVAVVKRRHRALLAAMVAACCASTTATGRPSIEFCDVPAVLPRSTPLGSYSPKLCFEYSGLGAGIHTLRVWLLETDLPDPPNCASSRWCERELSIDNSDGTNAAGRLLIVENMDVYDYGRFIWVARLFSGNQEQDAVIVEAESTPNRAPILAPIGDRAGTAGQSLSFAVSATDEENDSRVIGVDSLPPGSTFDGAQFSWPSPVAGTYTMCFQAVQIDDAPPLSDAEVVTITVLGAGPDQIGAWGPVIPWPTVPIHMHLLPTLEVLFWDRHGDGWDGEPRRWNPLTGAFGDAASLPWDIFCSGHAFMPDGRLLVTGGHVEEQVGEPKAAIYDPVTDDWERIPDMNGGRWYPTNTTLANGDVLTLAGTILPGVVNRLPQVWPAAGSAWRDLSGALQGDYPAWADFYPFMFLAPNGKVFSAGPQQRARYLDTAGTGAWADVADSSLPYRDYGSAVMYADGKVMIVGGNPRDVANPPVIVPSATTELIDLNDPTPEWRLAAPMAFGRRHLSTTILPDGKILATGGSSAPGFDSPAGAVLVPEMWDPETERWRVMASAMRYRGYHSNALLLPDGRVLVAGGGHPDPPGGVAESNAEIFSPPYLFRGPRPVITAAPAEVAYKQTFEILTPDASSITDVNWIRLSSVTHGFNENQRINRLDFTREQDRLAITAPSSHNLCPPGHYMLFILNGEGVPSESALVRIASCPAGWNGDADGDGTVDFADITAVLRGWGTVGPDGDADHDGDVDFADITEVLTFFGSACG